jgi:hypothetical protein
MDFLKIGWEGRAGETRKDGYHIPFVFLFEIIPFVFMVWIRMNYPPS